jgi:uncharacterized Zn-binding protein involved in type VI secretion
MFPPARMGDTITHDNVVPSGAITQGFPTVVIEGLPAARIGDLTACAGTISAGIIHPPLPAPPPIVKGNFTVIIGGQPAARWIIDTTVCGSFLGDPKLLATRKVFIGP